MLDLKRIWVYIAFAFGIAWATALVIYLTGGLSDSLTLISGTPITLATVLLPTLYMFSPAIANVLTRLTTGEGWRDLYLRPHLGRAWRVWILAWLGPVVLTLLGTILFFVLFPGTFDSSLSGLEEQLGQNASLDPAAQLALIVLGSATVAVVINCLVTFGEEFGWRAYLQPKLLPLGFRWTMVTMGVIWGVWHWPVIAMGYNYGRDYPGFPYLGMLAMVWFTFVAGTVIGWLAIWGDSVWPAVIAHATVNATGGLGVLVSSGQVFPLLGPAAIGLVGGVVWLLAALYLLWREPGLPERVKAPQSTQNER